MIVRALLVLVCCGSVHAEVLRVDRELAHAAKAAKAFARLHKLPVKKRREGAKLGLSVFLYNSPEQMNRVLATPLFVRGMKAVSRIHLRSGTIYLGRPDKRRDDLFYEAGKWFFPGREEAFMKFCLKGWKKTKGRSHGFR